MSEQTLKIMVSSTVYGFTETIEQICAILRVYGYEVLNSHIGTIFALSGASNMEECLKAVEECDLFLGIIRGHYGSGITHQELSKAIEMKKRRCFIVHKDVTTARILLEQFMYLKGSNGKVLRDAEGLKVKNPDFIFERTPIIEDIRVIDMYNEAIQDHVKPSERKEHWAQEFRNTSEILEFLKSQFSDKNKIIQKLNS